MNGKSKQRKVEMNCTDPELGDLFLFYLNGHVTSDQRGQIEEHLRDCEECLDETRFLEMAKRVEREKIATTDALLIRLARKEGSHTL